jgi:hypothetical protein
VANQPSIANAMKPRVENHAKGVSCGTFKCTYIVKRILSCVYIGVSGGHQRPVAGTLTRLTKHLKLEKCRARLKKSRMSLLKNSAKIDLKNERKINRQMPPKLLSNVRSKVRPKRRGPNRISVKRALDKRHFGWGFSQSCQNAVQGAPH